MALIRNSGTRLSNITDAFSRLQLQHTGSSFTFQCPSQLRLITQTRPNLLKDFIQACSSTTLDHDRSSRKHTDSSRKWEEEDDQKLYQLVKEGVKALDIYAKHFRDRSSHAVSLRASWAARLIRIQEQQARDGVRPGEIDIAKSVAGEEGAPSMRTVYDRIRKKGKGKRQEANSDEAPNQRPCVNKWVSSRRKEWTADEDALLRRLVERNIDLPASTLWAKVSGGDVDGSLLLRAPVACSRRWKHLQPPRGSQIGRWTKVEELRLQKAISNQLKGKYQVIVDVLVGQPTATENPLKDRFPELQQLQGQEGLPILKLGSKQLGMLSWVQIAEQVKSRDERDSRDHFYNVYHTGARGYWTEEESRRMKEGLQMFGKDFWKVSEHIGTRSPSQVTRRMAYKQQRIRTSGQEAVEIAAGKNQ
ncbi:Myb-like DNA-binding domain protein [Linnemannia gamsii]|uniref:Myb-like DNA-binding domain protein n=1 Tax=Linnemannia gamsii TaxID=64522 RepID=A0ABQ7JTP3_9FUNG|nr:Myb-like DNA-binding domain protein [Linnemannia gamsii]